MSNNYDGAFSENKSWLEDLFLEKKKKKRPKHYILIKTMTLKTAYI